MATDSFLRGFKEDIAVARGQNENSLGPEAHVIKTLAKRRLKKADGIIAAQQARIDDAEAVTLEQKVRLNQADATIATHQGRLEEANGKMISQRQEIERIREETELMKEEVARMKKEMESMRTVQAFECNENDLMAKLDPSMSLSEDELDEIAPESMIS
jgi:chromosome segregation ATPase